MLQTRGLPWSSIHLYGPSISQLLKESNYGILCCSVHTQPLYPSSKDGDNRSTRLLHFWFVPILERLRIFGLLFLKNIMHTYRERPMACGSCLFLENHQVEFGASRQISVGHLGPSLCGETMLTRIILVLLSAHHVKRSLTQNYSWKKRSTSFLRSEVSF